MTNIKISKKGKALFKNRALSAKVAKEIINKGALLSSRGSINIDVDGKTITIKVPS